jgi:probable rRNA maturation factor
MTARPRSRGTPGLVIDIVTESAQWDAAPQAEAIVRGAITAADRAAAAERAAAAAGEIRYPAELAVMLTDDAGIRALNARWRGHDKATNVLSFPAAPPGGHAPVGAHAMRLLGDIVIAYETAAREATAEQKPFTHHLAHLAVHGFLHLLGYDHESDDDAEAMERLERAILAQLDVPDPYVARDSGTCFDA